MNIETLEQGKIHVQQGLSDGVNCPCCGQYAKLYRRKIYATPARELIALYHLDRKDGGAGMYYHISNFRHLHGGDISKLRYWGLVEEGVNDDDEKRTSGSWRITERGRQFVRAEIVVSKYCYIYNGESRGFSDEHQSIIDALGKKFNYTELMGMLI